MNPNPGLHFGCLFMMTKSIKKQVLKKRKAWGWGERAALIPDPPSDQRVLIFLIVTSIFIDIISLNAYLLC